MSTTFYAWNNPNLPAACKTDPLSLTLDAADALVEVVQITTTPTYFHFAVPFDTVFVNNSTSLSIRTRRSGGGSYQVSPQFRILDLNCANVGIFSDPIFIISADGTFKTNTSQSLGSSPLILRAGYRVEVGLTAFAGQEYELEMRNSSWSLTADSIPPLGPTIPSSNPFVPYGTQQEAQAYFDALLHRTAWANYPLQDREKALNSATQRIDLLAYRGSKVDPEQVNAFPRCIDEVDIGTPTDVEEATYEIALAYLNGVDPDKEIKELTLSSFAFANVRQGFVRDIVPEHYLAGIPSSVAWAKLKPYLRDPNSFTLLRG